MQAVQAVAGSCVQVPAQRCGDVVLRQQGLQAGCCRAAHLRLGPDGAEGVVRVHDDGRLAGVAAQDQGQSLTMLMPAARKHWLAVEYLAAGLISSTEVAMLQFLPDREEASGMLWPLFD